MSLDLSLDLNACGQCGRCAESIFDINITYNLGPMWSAARGKKGRLIEIDGMSGKDSLKELKPVFRELTSDRDKYILFNPINGWGSYDGLLNALDKIIEAAEKYPLATWSAGR